MLGLSLLIEAPGFCFVALNKTERGVHSFQAGRHDCIQFGITWQGFFREHLAPTSSTARWRQHYLGYLAVMAVHAARCG